MMDSTNAVPALGALAQETRLAIFRLLVEHGREGLPAGQIAERLGVPAATLSFHLAQLAHAGLVDSRRESRSIIYVVNVEQVNDLIRFLTEDCCGGRPELCLPNAAACAPKTRTVVTKLPDPKFRKRARTGS
jgi:ArsR family transcriptional regulator